MAVLPILISGEPVLHAPADPVVSFGKKLHTLVSDMFDTMATAPGVGLAGPQVGVGKRLFVYDWTDDNEVQYRGVAINPVLWITPAPTGDENEETEMEGCLSFPGERFALHRGERAVLQGYDLNGKPFEIRAEGWLARIFQHEFDHLEGRLYIDRLSYPHSEDARKTQRKRGWGVPGHSWLPGVDHLEG